MADLEARLEQLSVDVAWPPTPAFDLRPRRRRWPLVAALAVVLAAGLALAVPQSRGALLRFFHLGGVSVERVEVLPHAQDVPFVAALGTRVSRARAAALLGRPFAIPNGPVYASGPAVSSLLPGRILFSEANWHAGAEVLKKYAAGATSVEFLHVDGAPALWIHGARHVFLAPTLPPRYAGNTLVWQRGPITYRLEGRALSLARARSIAHGIR